MVTTMGRPSGTAATACPGEAVYDLLTTGALMAAVTERLAAEPATLEIACGEEAKGLIADIEAGVA